MFFLMNPKQFLNGKFWYYKFNHLSSPVACLFIVGMGSYEACSAPVPTSCLWEGHIMS